MVWRRGFEKATGVGWGRLISLIQGVGWSLWSSNLNLCFDWIVLPRRTLPHALALVLSELS